MPSSRSNRRTATIAIQSLLGGFCFALWAVGSVVVFDDELMRVVATGLPYFIFYELGILSRYVPGVRSAAKRLE